MIGLFKTKSDEIPIYKHSQNYGNPLAQQMIDDLVRDGVNLRESYNDETLEKKPTKKTDVSITDNLGRKRKIKLTSGVYHPDENIIVYSYAKSIKNRQTYNKSPKYSTKHAFI
ncbi:MAG: hypothetical protein CMF62_03930 [Magnetococcales bacterium]|nr:hypothetical protein [Magnetococcales bacterium]|tara:strand:+ start:16238 stop:16576 length:339 start_codon:yes stop_codon:yes gene_type:complete